MLPVSWYSLLAQMHQSEASPASKLYYCNRFTPPFSSVVQVEGQKSHDPAMAQLDTKMLMTMAPAEDKCKSMSRWNT